jgi:magnesium-protoporphyrin O-methyltransferase
MVNMDCCIHTQDMNSYFGDTAAKKEMAQYLKKGLAAHAADMVTAVAARGVEGATLLEVGGGIGSVYVELLKRGATRATNVEVSSSYLTNARALADQLGIGDRVDYCRADFARHPESASAADIVIMHRVICCYPDMPRLVTAAAQHARRVLALSFPRNEWYMRLFIEAQAKWLQIKGSNFRNYVHLPQDIFGVAADSGLRVAHQSFSGTWQIVVFER